MGKGDAIFKKTNWYKFLKNSVDSKIYSLTQINVSATEIVLERAKILEDLRPGYNLFNKNCEHTAVWCKTGEWKSLQTQISHNINNLIIKKIFGENAEIIRKNKTLIIQMIHILPLRGLENFLNQHFSGKTKSYRTQSNQSKFIEKYEQLKSILDIFLIPKFDDTRLCISEIPYDLQQKYHNYYRFKKIKIILLILFFALIMILITINIYRPQNILQSSEYPNYCNGSYLVKQNDTLTGIADKCYQNSENWKKICEVNTDKIQYPNCQTINCGNTDKSKKQCNILRLKTELIIP